MDVIRDMFAEFRTRRDELEVSVDEVREQLSGFSEVLLYGAGSSGIAFLDFLRRRGMDADAFLDSSADKIGGVCEGLPVLSPEEAGRTASERSLVIVCINTDGIRYCKSFDEALRAGGHHAVYDKLRGLGFENVIDYTFFRRCFALFSGEKYNAPSCSDIDLMLRHEGEISQAYGLLADPASREVYEKIVRFRLLDDTLRVPTLPQERQYFEPEFYTPRRDASFIDCGAFNGISLKTFLKVNGGEFAVYYGLEPDAGNFARLEEFVSSLQPEQRARMKLCRAAAWEDDGGARLYALHGPGSFLARDIGQAEVPTVQIDALLAGTPATFIKMNIEGSEKQALRGAENTIRTCRPQLAIAGYHRTEDLWEIPLMIKGYCPDYSLRLRSYMNHISFIYYGQ